MNEDFQYVNTIHLFRVEVFKKLQRMEIVSFDQRMPQVAIGCIFYTVYRDKGRKNRLAKLRHSNERIKRTLALFACGFIDNCCPSVRDRGHKIYIAYVLSLNRNKRSLADSYAIQRRTFGNVILKHKPELFCLLKRATSCCKRSRKFLSSICRMRSFIAAILISSMRRTIKNYRRK